MPCIQSARESVGAWLALIDECGRLRSAVIVVSLRAKARRVAISQANRVVIPVQEEGDPPIMTSTSEALAVRGWLADLLESQSSWRAMKAQDWPDDKRNARCSRALANAANYVRTLNGAHPQLVRFVELGETLDEERLNGGVETISGTDAAGRFFFDNNSQDPTERDFDWLLECMFIETLESWADSPTTTGIELPASFVEYLKANGVT